MLFVELCGLPGAGKSSVVRVAKNLLAQAGLQALDRNDLVRLTNRTERVRLATATAATRAFLRWPTVVKYAFAVKPVRLNRLRDALIAIGRGELVTRMGRQVKPDVVLLEQWLLQDLWALGQFASHRPSDASAVHAWRALAPLHSHGVVFMEAPAAVAAHRVYNRSDGTSRYELGSVETNTKMFSKAAGHFGQMLAIATAEGSYAHTVDATQDLDVSASQLAEVIAGWVYSAEPGPGAI